LHMAQLMPLPLTVSCSSKIQTGFTFLAPAHTGSPGQGVVKHVCVCACVRACVRARGRARGRARVCSEAHQNYIVLVRKILGKILIAPSIYNCQHKERYMTRMTAPAILPHRVLKEISTKGDFGQFWSLKQQADSCI